MWQKLSKIFKSSFYVISVILVIILWTGISYYLISFAMGTSDIANNDSSDTSDTGESSEPEDCNVYGINLHGFIATYHGNDAYNDQGKLALDQTSADEVVWAMKEAQDKDNIKALAIEIDSTGGYVEAGEEMMLAFKQSKKPVVAFIRNRGLSAAYLAATGAGTIFASKLSDVGGIGVTASYLQETEKNKKAGLTYIDLSSGIYKDSGNPIRPLSDNEKQLFMRDIKISYDYFVSLVAQNRNIDIEKVKKLADGSSVMGEQALKDGLIDKIGLFPDVKNFLTEKIGTEAVICWQN
jgi:protease-4